MENEADVLLNVSDVLQEEKGIPTPQNKVTESEIEDILLGEQEDQVGPPQPIEMDTRSTTPVSFEEGPTRSESTEWEVERRTKKAIKKRLQRERYRSRAREEKERKGDEGTSQGGSKSHTSTHDQRPSRAKSGTASKEQFPTLEEANLALHSKKAPHPPSKSTKRGPGARDEARRKQTVGRKYDLPKAPRSVREESEGLEVTPHSKRPRGTLGTPSSGDLTPKRLKESGISPLKRAEGSKTSTAAPTSGMEGPSVESYRDAARGKDMQIIVLSNREGGKITAQEGEALRKNLKRFSLESMGDRDTFSGRVLRFWQSGIVEPGWLLVTAVDAETRDWTLQNWKPPSIEDISFKVVAQKEAPWPTKIGISIREEEKPDPEEIRLEMHLRNRLPGALEWKLDHISGGPGNWHVVMWIPRSSVRALDEVKWRVFLGLISMVVHRVRGPAPTTESDGNRRSEDVRRRTEDGRKRDHHRREEAGGRPHRSGSRRQSY